jgi:hypothetical protein
MNDRVSNVDNDEDCSLGCQQVSYVLLDTNDLELRGLLNFALVMEESHFQVILLAAQKHKNNLDYFSAKSERN